MQVTLTIEIIVKGFSVELRAECPLEELEQQLAVLVAHAAHHDESRNDDEST